MPIIKLNAINSTNTFIKEMISTQTVENFTVVTTEYQTEGKGQMGTNWMSQPSKNLLFSVFVDVSKCELESPFYISMVAALAIKQSLSTFLIPQIRIKWPNDILSENKKVCGVLIENVMKQGIVTGSIIGIGLNVNQTDFKTLPKATSLKNSTGRNFNTDELLNNIVANLKLYVAKLQQGQLLALKSEYESYLFRKNKPSTFKDAKGNMFLGYITSVEASGHLQVVVEDNITKSFALKDISLLY